jgi:FkbM family methyltransferase
MADFSYIPKEQYFPDFLQLEKEIFADVGGFDGQTSLELIKRCPDYKAVYIFEPSQDNLDLAKKNLFQHSNVQFIAKGLSNKFAELRFKSHDGAASSISELGDVVIEVDALDKIVSEKITFLKMDIEGAESLAIEGAMQHILNDHPKIAIAVYHKSDDFWQIPTQILAIRNDYDLHLRHYTEGTDETVMYFLPKNS